MHMLPLPSVTDVEYLSDIIYGISKGIIIGQHLMPTHLNSLPSGISINGITAQHSKKISGI